MVEYFWVFLTLLGLLHVRVAMDGFLAGLAYNYVAILGNNLGYSDQGVASYYVVSMHTKFSNIVC